MPTLIENVVGTIGLVIARWYWVVLPFIAWRFASRAWLWWRKELWENKQEYSYLELIAPEEVTRPFPAMEQVLAYIWGIHSNLRGLKNLDKRWWKGRRPPYVTLEVASIGPQPHLIVRCFKRDQQRVTAAFYSQFPDMQIAECPDYTRLIPAIAPTKEWEMFAVDMELIRKDPYPIKTYSEFFEPRWELQKEEKRIDPLNGLLEGLASLKNGEMMWIQIRLEPIIPGDHQIFERGIKVVEKLAYRKKATKKGLIGEVATRLVPTPAPSPYQRKTESFIPTELKLTPRERAVVESVERKIGKQLFAASIRYVYFAKPRLFTKDHARLVTQYFQGFNAPDLNGFKEVRRTKTKGYYYLGFLPFIVNRFVHLRQRRMMRKYLMRETIDFPRGFPASRSTFALNVEEVATIYHLPFSLKQAGTYLPRVTSRMGEEPLELPSAEGEVFQPLIPPPEDYFLGRQPSGEATPAASPTGAPANLPVTGS